MNKLQMAQQILKAINECSDTPAEEMIQQGEALVKIGRTLKGRTVTEARSVMIMVNELMLNEEPKKP